MLGRGVEVDRTSRTWMYPIRDLIHRSSIKRIRIRCLYSRHCHKLLMVLLHGTHQSDTSLVRVRQIRVTIDQHRLQMALFLLNVMGRPLLQDLVMRVTALAHCALRLKLINLLHGI